MSGYQGIILQPGAGVTLKAKQRPSPMAASTVVDPDDPAWQQVVYMRYKPNGRITALKMYQAQSNIDDHPYLWEQASEEEYQQYEAEMVKKDAEDALRYKDVVDARIATEKPAEGQIEATVAALSEKVDKMASVMEQLIALQTKQLTNKE